ncbi:hypothetical protein TNCT_648521 [Trichonephila clavata]|uniref:Transmembrane protein n=1 Tax=Trichonephila clavata TaxID=2740835 RepID=A0A8X6HZQ3_TRICU|nr:hypothetical protein TNCT_648521 [Trichonephila clavata]
MISEHEIEFWAFEAESGSERFVVGSDPVSRSDLWLALDFSYTCVGVIGVTGFGIFWVLLTFVHAFWVIDFFFDWSVACPMFLGALQTPSFDIAVLRTVVEVITVVTLRCSRSVAERIPSNGHIAAVANV